MHVGLIIGKLGGGGSERSVVNLAGGLTDRGHRVDIVLFEPTIDQRVGGAVRVFVMENKPDKGIAGNGVWDWIHMAAALQWDPTCLPSPRLMRQARAVARYIEGERPDCVLTNLSRANVATLLASRVLVDCPPVVPIIRDVAGSRGRTHRRYRRLFDGAAHFVGVSEGVAGNFSGTFGVSPERMSTIYNPVVTPDLPMRMAEAPAHPWLRDGDTPVILAAGRLVEQKDFSTLLRAFARVAPRRPCRLVILGEGEQRNEIEGLARDLDLADRVSLPGWVENPFAFMSRASLFVLSSRHEGLPGVLVQALACGCPCVSTDCPAGPAEILRDGEICPLVPVENPDAMAEAMLRVLDRPPDARTLERRAGDFSVERAAEAYEELLARLV